MAVQTLLIEIKWENTNYFQLQAKLNDEDANIICKVEEDGSIAQLWGTVQTLCQKYFESKMTEIGREMIA